MNPEPRTLNPEPWTLDPGPWTLPLLPLLQVVTGWNGQAVSAFALAARVLAGEHVAAGCSVSSSGRAAGDGGSSSGGGGGVSESGGGFPVEGHARAEYLRAAVRVGA